MLAFNVSENFHTLLKRKIGKLPLEAKGVALSIEESSAPETLLISPLGKIDNIPFEAEKTSPRLFTRSLPFHHKSFDD